MVSAQRPHDICVSDSPRTLILSQDYELFFQDSGSVESCLIKPCDALLHFADANDARFTFFIDAGMLLAMQRYADEEPALAAELKLVREHISMLAERGHEIALHVHPHWEDTVRVNGEWRFGGTRYQLRSFDDADILGIFRRYSAILNELSGARPTSYRAGGFCVEPFSKIAPALSELGIQIDSSVVPGATLHDPEKGFDFSSAPDEAFWEFTESPGIVAAGGEFLQIPITPQVLPQLFYWGRLVERLGPKAISRKFGDGTSKAIGRSEIIRRLAMASRVAELSMDDAKAPHLLKKRNWSQQRDVWHVMGHPKLASDRSIDTLKRFIERVRIEKIDTVSGFAARCRDCESGC